MPIKKKSEESIVEEAEKAIKKIEKNVEEGIEKLKEKSEDTLVPIEDYLKSSIHLGTRVITPQMKQFVYKRRADGLAVFNSALIDRKLRESVDFLAKFAPEDIILVCKREAGWKS